MVRMFRISILGFRGTGFSDPRYTDQPALIRAGHVGFILETLSQIIFGFHPTDAAVLKYGDMDTLLERLKDHYIVEGKLFDDTWIFESAWKLSHELPRCTVYIYTQFFTPEQYHAIQSNVEIWYTSRKGLYAFPDVTGHTPAPNCAVFIRRFGINIPEGTGQIKHFMAALETLGRPWTPGEV